MRPRGPIRLALAEALISPGTTRELAARTQVALDATRRTICNMRRAGEAVVIGRVRVDGVKQLVPIYAPAPPAREDRGFEQLQIFFAAL